MTNQNTIGIRCKNPILEQRLIIGIILNKDKLCISWVRYIPLSHIFFVLFHVSWILDLFFLPRKRYLKSNKINAETYVKMQGKIASIQSIEEDYFFLYNPASTDTASEFSIYLLCLSNNRNMKIQQKSARF